MRIFRTLASFRLMLVLIAVSAIVCGFSANANAAYQAGLFGMGSWQYDQANQTFSNLPEMVVQNTNGLYITLGDISWHQDSVNAMVADQTDFSLFDSADTLLLTGRINSGHFSAFGNGALFYVEDTSNISISWINQAVVGQDIVSMFASPGSNISVNLSMLSFSGNILSGNSSGVISGTLNFVPEPTSILVIGLGSFLLFARKQ